MMAEGRERCEWRQTSEILCLLFNAHRDPNKTTPKAPSHFFPFKDETQAPVTPLKVSITVLRDLFVRRRRKPATP